MLITYYGAELDVHPRLAAIWPYHLPPEKWPSFCGAGGGFGDWIVEEDPCGVVCSCCCANHDVDWSVAEKTKFAAIQGNFRFYKNLRNFILANYDKSRYSRNKVERVCLKWFFAVCAGLFLHFDPLGGGDAGNREVEQIIARIQRAVEEYES